MDLGADRAVNPDREDVREAVRDFTRGEGVDVVMDAIGLEGTIQLALEVLRPGGRVVAFGNLRPEFTAGYADLFLREKDILGVRANTKEDLLAVTDLVAAGRLKPIVSRLLPLADFREGLKSIEEN
jgi:threonine dehydrogenase-like Zn-dependent dehydrogenase